MKYKYEITLQDGKIVKGEIECNTMSELASELLWGEIKAVHLSRIN